MKLIGQIVVGCLLAALIWTFAGTFMAAFILLLLVWLLCAIAGSVFEIFSDGLSGALDWWWKKW